MHSTGSQSDLIRWDEQSDTKGEDTPDNTMPAAGNAPEEKGGLPYMGPPPFDSGKGKK